MWLLLISPDFFFLLLNKVCSKDLIEPILHFSTSYIYIYIYIYSSQEGYSKRILIWI